MPHDAAAAGAAGALSATAVIGTLAGAYKFSEFLYKLKKLHGVAGQNGVFVRLSRRLHADIAEAERLLLIPEIQFALSRNPEKKQWIEVVVLNTKQALESIGGYTERVQSDLDAGKHVGIINRMRWVLIENEKLMTRKIEIAASHQSLMSVLGFLGSLEPLACCDTPPKEFGASRQTYQPIFRNTEEEIEDDGPLPDYRAIPIRANWLASRL